MPKLFGPDLALAEAAFQYCFDGIPNTLHRKIQEILFHEQGDVLTPWRGLLRKASGREDRDGLATGERRHVHWAGIVADGKAGRTSQCGDVIKRGLA